MSRLKALVLVGIWACGGGKPAPVTPPTPTPAPVQASTPTPTPTPAPTPTPTPAPEKPFTVDDKSEPEFFPPAWKKVAVGQTISFSTAVIDQDLDETAVSVSKMPATAKFDAVTQTITWTPGKDEVTKKGYAPQFTIAIDQSGRSKKVEKSFGIDVVTGKAVAEPVAPTQAAVIETLLLIRTPKRLEQVNKDWPLEKLLAVGAETFKLQIPEDKRAKLKGSLDGQTSYTQMLQGLAQTHNNPRLDPSSPQFDKNAFGSPADWKIVAFRPRIDRAWTELRVVYRAVKAPEPVFAMFRLRPVVEYVPALPRPDEEREANNKIFLGMVAKHLMKNGGPNPKFVKDEAAEGKAVSALMTELMTFDDTKTKPYLHGFEIGIALEARMGGGSARNADGTYKSGDGWGWSAQKPFQTSEGSTQVYQNVAIPGFWTQTVPNKDNTAWTPRCAPRFNPEDKFVPGYEILCRKTMGLVDLPATKDGKIVNGRVDANNMYFEHKKRWSVENFPLEDGRRDVGEENGMTCSQCHIRNFGMHDYSDPANVDPSKGTPKAVNKAIATLNFQIVPSTTWEAFTLDFLKHQECRGKSQFEKYVGADSAKGLTCPLAAK
ncbi:MAG TPA: hypothetical protein VL326_08250 [Kofleriaceae bacterium]|nr:hypothetical protein [Kofleriaceae bacterium]